MRYNGQIIKIPMKALSINTYFQGKRYKTKKAKAYDQELQIRLPNNKIEAKYYFVSYKFYVDSKTFKMADIDNMIKGLQDNLVKKGLIKDDRFIIKIEAEKIMADKNEIEIEISPYNISKSEKDDTPNLFEIMEF